MMPVGAFVSSLGGELLFSFGGPDRSVAMEVVETTDRRVLWRGAAGPDEWVDGLVTFDLEQTGDETVLLEADPLRRLAYTRAGATGAPATSTVVRSTQPRSSGWSEWPPVVT
jgi:hypothetical protein